MKKNFIEETGNTLDHESPIPLHYQLSEIIRYEALNGSLADDNGRMPTEAELANRFKVSRVTVRSALKSLVDEGLLWRERGRGTFLRTNKVENWVGQLMGYAETIQAAGFKPGGKVVCQRITKELPKKVKESLLIEEAWELKRIRLADDHPIAIEHSFFPTEVGQELSVQPDLDNVLIYKFIERELQIALQKAKQLISAINASEEEAEKLNIQSGDALLYIERVTFSNDNRPIEFLKAIYRPEYFHYVIELKR